MTPTLRAQILQKLIVAYQQLLALLTMNQPTPRLYDVAKQCLGEHITLNPTVDSEVGCAEAVSYILKQCGIALPANGIASTAQLYKWLSTNPRFTPTEGPEVGAVLVSPTGYGNNSVEGHTGICAKYNVQFPNDWGILSNNSDNGLFQEKWSLRAWESHYQQKGGLPLFWFRYVGV